MRLSSLTLITVLALTTVVACSTQAPPSPTQAPAAPKAAEPTKAAPAPAPTVAPTAVAKADWPQKGKAMTVIVPWPAGGGTDIAARVLAAGLQKELDIPVEVVNKVGAGSQVGITELSQARPDAYTLAYVSLPGGMVTYLDPDRKASYGRKDLQPVILHSTAAGSILVKADSPYKDLKDLLDVAKAKPNSIKMAISGVMTLGHLEIVQLQQMTGAKFSFVQFDGAAPAITAVLGGHVDAYVSSLVDHFPHVKSGNARVLGVADTVRNKEVPDVKTFKEQGFDMVAYLSTGLIAPAGTPKEALASISGAAKKIVDTPEHQAKLKEIGQDPHYLGTSDFEKFWADLENTIMSVMPAAKQSQ